MYKIKDLQIEGRDFAGGSLYHSKREILSQLVDYHDIDFSGVDDKDNELSIVEYFKFWKIKGLKAQLNWILQYGEWSIEKATIKIKRLKDVYGINRHRRWRVNTDGKEEIISTNEEVLGAKYYVGEAEYKGMKWFKTFKEAKEYLFDVII